MKPELKIHLLTNSFMPLRFYQLDVFSCSFLEDSGRSFVNHIERIYGYFVWSLWCEMSSWKKSDLVYRLMEIKDYPFADQLLNCDKFPVYLGFTLLLRCWVLLHEVLNFSSEVCLPRILALIREFTINSQNIIFIFELRKIHCGRSFEIIFVLCKKQENTEKTILFMSFCCSMLWHRISSDQNFRIFTPILFMQI